MTHDNNGAISQVAVGANTTDLVYDERDRLIQRKDNGMVNVTFGYDALNRRINANSYGDNRNFLFDGWQPVQELSGSTPTANLLTGPGLDEIYRRSTTAANTSNPSVTNDYLTDALHSTMALTDASGTIQTTYSYEPYGMYSTYGTASDNIYLFTGREDFGDALRNFRNRYLTTVGSFTQEDPIGFNAGQNKYLYVGGTPTRYRDPLGFSFWDDAKNNFDGQCLLNCQDFMSPWCVVRMSALVSAVFFKLTF